MSIRLDSTKLVGKPTWPIHIKLPNPARGGRETGAAGFIHETHRVYASIEGGSRWSRLEHDDRDQRTRAR